VGKTSGPGPGAGGPPGGKKKTAGSNRPKAGAAGTSAKGGAARPPAKGGAGSKSGGGGRTPPQTAKRVAPKSDRPGGGGSRGGRPAPSTRPPTTRPDVRAPLELSEGAAKAVAVGAFLLAIAYLPKITSSNLPPEFTVLLVLGAAGLPLLIARALDRTETERTETEKWASRCAIAFVVIGLVSAVVATAPTLAVFGLYVQRTGWLFMLAVAGCWALGTGIGAKDRHWLELALIAGALVNAVVAILQQLVGLNGIGFTDFSGLPDGLQGNPVFLSALLAASLALIAPRFNEMPRRWWWVLTAIGIALGMSGERLSALLALAVAAYLVWTSRPARTEAPDPEAWRRALYFAGLTLASLVGGSLVARAAGGVGVVSHTVSSTTSATFGQRLEYWWLGLRATLSHPLLGSGPDQFQAATSPLVPTSFARSNGGGSGVIFLDAHNMVIEYASTIGLIGCGLLIAWLVFALRNRRGPLLGFAVVLLIVELAEPQDLVVTPLAFLALGAAAFATGVPGPGDDATSPRKQAVEAPTWPAARAPGWWRPATVGALVAAGTLGVLLLIGDFSYQAGFNQVSTSINTALNSERRANSVLFAWPEPAIVSANLYASLAAGHVAGTLPLALQWGQGAVNRNPTDGSLWATLAHYQQASGDFSAARHSAQTAVRNQPWNTSALNILGALAAADGHNAEARYWFGRSLAVIPTQSPVRGYLKHLSEGCRVQGPPSRAGTLRFSCPR